MIRKKELEITLERLYVYPQPKIWLEQYTIPSEIAAEILLIASSTRRDIAGKLAIDLGCGTGRLAIGASILGAEEVVAVDIDPIAIQIARENARTLEIQNTIQWINSNVEMIRGSFDTAIMNPPFGTKTRHADRQFLLKALSIANITYSLHKRTTRYYLLKLIENNFGKIEALYEMQLRIPKTYAFHKKSDYNVNVDLYITKSRR